MLNVLVLTLILMVIGKMRTMLTKQNIDVTIDATNHVSMLDIFFQTSIYWLNINVS